MCIKVLFFDLDGLLIDTEKIYLHCWMKAANELGYPITREDVLKLRSCDSEIARKIVEDKVRDVVAYERLRTRRREVMAEYIKTYPIVLKTGVKEFFSSTKLDKYLKYIVTSAIPDDKLSILKESGVLDKIDKVISTKDVSRGKPFPDIYLYAVKEAGVDPGECIAFEDSPNGALSAYRAGVRVIMVPDLTQPNEELLKHCSYVCSSIADAVDII